MKTILLACVSVAAAAPQQFGTGNFNSFNFDQEVRGFSSGNSRNSLFAEETTPPVPILRQIQERNPDGSYTYGYESGDGTYKIETRYATGEVKGKYGYYDASGKLREVTYGAEPERGFEPVIEGVIVAPPTINPEPEFNAEPVFAEPEPAPVQRPSQPVRKTVVRRPRPQPQQRAEQPRFSNFQPSDLPSSSTTSTSNSSSSSTSRTTTCCSTATKISTTTSCSPTTKISTTTTFHSSSTSTNIWTLAFQCLVL